MCLIFIVSEKSYMSTKQEKNPIKGQSVKTNVYFQMMTLVNVTADVKNFTARVAVVARGPVQGGGKPYCLIAVGDDTKAMIMRLYNPDQHKKVQAGTTVLVTNGWNNRGSLFITSVSSVIVLGKTMTLSPQIQEVAESLSDLWIRVHNGNQSKVCPVPS